MEQPSVMLWAIAALAVLVQMKMVWPATDRRRYAFAFDTSQEGLVFSVLGVLFIFVFFRFNLHLIPIIVFVILVHEYGHVLAYRLAGHRDPKMRLEPFGGSASSREMKSSQVESAYISLMGPGFSAALLAAALMFEAVAAQTGGMLLFYASNIVFFTALLNFFNLLPLYPLDGGRALRSVATLFGPDVARTAALGMSGALGVLGLLAFWSGRPGGLFLLFFGAAGAAAAIAEARLDRGVRPMNGAEAGLTLMTHAALLALFGLTIPDELLLIFFGR